ncbi:MAG: hemerythrin domain-containing protein [Clostridiales bacterium]|nr:hemerythrin domain-containing protein [Clostridiales bacterium]
MDGIKLMVEEHKNIKIMLEVIRKICFSILNGKEINYSDFEMIIDFVRNYADKNHHGKEEVILFNRMVDEIGGPAEKLVKFGMLVEHDLGRLYIKELEEALEKVKKGDNEAKLDVIANAISYTHLLNRHIEKEDNVVYTFAERELKKETLDIINKECEEYEKESSLVVEKNIKNLEYLQEKYK